MPRRPRPALSELDLFAGCTPGELARLGPLLTMVRVDAGRVLITEGGIGLEFLIIVDGTAEVTIGRGAGTRRVAILGPGDFVGEMSLLTGDRRSASVRALTPLRLYVANSAEFGSFTDASPRVARRIMAAAEARASANRAA